ncbi:phosphatidylcholine transfer protein [Hippocampus comes]|uniref:Phosphatidylcholine transfer protein n=1 Tax=Hippocampus comes TaxID=109280 RepID=A0A3Q2YPH4_HIPCM|nr:PREDICTED: phosphatidylcholine transfer protein [Hippocampus comes]
MSSLRFTEEDFAVAWKELDEPQLDGGWQLFTETMGVHIYRLLEQKTGLYEYKVFGSLDDCKAELCADVYMDLAYRKHWDPYVKELTEKEIDGQRAIYWEVAYPFPLSNRDYVYVRERRVLDVGGRKIWVVLARSSPETPYPEKNGVLRVKDYKQTIVMEANGHAGTKVFINYFDNPGGMIPSWLVNWAAKSGVPAFLTDMKKACVNYPLYCQNK